MPNHDNRTKTSRRTIVIAWGLWALSPILMAAAITTELKVDPQPDVWVAMGLAFTALSTVGLIVVLRRPSNPIGWIFVVVPVVANVGNFASSYADVALIAKPGSYPAGIWAAWLASWGWYVAMMAIGLIPILFPEGLPSRRWRPFLWLGVGGMALLALTFGLAPGPLDWSPSGTSFSNPLGVEFLGDVADLLQGVAGVSWFTCFGAGIVSLGVKLRRSRGIQRQQIKAFAVGGLVTAVLLGTSILLDGFLPDALSTIMFAAMVMALPVSAGLAILRYRLYDIDRILNRGIVYIAVTVLLLGTYMGSVIALQNVFRIGGDSDLAIVMSTLAVAALFTPVRKRVQEAVDRRFYRRKYNAQKTLQDFGVRLRDEVDLEQLETELEAVVRTTIQPSHASLWLPKVMT